MDRAIYGEPRVGGPERTLIGPLPRTEKIIRLDDGKDTISTGPEAAPATP